MLAVNSLKVPMSYNPQAIEPKWQKYWDDNETFRVDAGSSKPKVYSRATILTRKFETRYLRPGHRSARYHLVENGDDDTRIEVELGSLG